MTLAEFLIDGEAPRRHPRPADCLMPDLSPTVGVMRWPSSREAGGDWEDPLSAIVWAQPGCARCKQVVAAMRKGGMRVAVRMMAERFATPLDGLDELAVAELMFQDGLLPVVWLRGAFANPDRWLAQEAT